MNINFDEIYYFGDSLTDAGGIFSLSSAVIATAGALGFDTTGFEPIPISPPYDGQFSNGDVYAQIAPRLFGIDPSNVFNFAFGGAEARGVQTLLDAGASIIPPDLQNPSILPPSLSALLTQNINLDGQLELFEDALALRAPSAHAAASLFIGLNDFANFMPFSPITAPAEILVLANRIVDTTLDAARAIGNAGIGTIILNTLPDASFFPASDLLNPLFTFLGDTAIDIVNLGLVNGARALERSDLTVEIVDFNALSEDIFDNFDTYGFLEFDEPALFGNGIMVVPNPAVSGLNIDQIAFFDPVHFTTNLHGIFAAFTHESLTSNAHIRGDFTDIVFGNQFDDFVLARGGNDFIFLRSGDDVAIGGRGNDRIFGHAGSDLLSGGAGRDEIDGGSGDDLIAGGSGADRLIGNLGNDILIDGLGNDTVFGGKGDDILLYTQAALIGGTGEASDIFNGGSGHDTLILTLSAATIDAEREHFNANFVTGQAFQFLTINLLIDEIETVLFQTSLGVPDFDSLGVLAPTGNLADRLAEADLFGFI